MRSNQQLRKVREKSFNLTVAKNLTLMRKALNISQQEVSKSLNRTQQQYSKLENGDTHITAAIIMTLHQEHGFSIHDFFSNI